MTEHGPIAAAPQHAPRPLPLFLEMLRSETADDDERRARALAGLNAYQAAERIPREPPMPEVARVGRACLRDYGGGGPPVIFVPSLINPPFVLDLTPGNSLLRWLATQGVRPLLVDWGAPTPDERDLDIAGHVEQLLVPLIDALGEQSTLVGYCLGGTMAIAAAALRPPRKLALIATPWRFAGFPQAARDDLARLWQTASPACRALGLVPAEVLQAAFWRLDPARTIAKFETFAAMTPGGEAARGFVALEDWANAGAPLTYAAGREAFESLFAADLTGKGRWSVADSAIDPAALTCPVLDIVSLTDRIVPAASATGLPDRRELAAGHVGMVVGGRAKAQLWEPLLNWLR